MTYSYVPLPFDGKHTRWKSEYGPGALYPLDTSGRRGAPLAWACRNADDAATLARIFDGELDASPARRGFGSGAEPEHVTVRMCVSCWRRAAARAGGTICESCKKRRRVERERARAAAKPVPRHPDTDAPISPEAARRVALKARRRALAAWMAGEGSIPPHIAAVADKAERRTA